MTYPPHRTAGPRIARRAILALAFAPLALACRPDTVSNPLVPSMNIQRTETGSDAEMKDGSNVSTFSGTVNGRSYPKYDPATNSNHVHLVGTAIVGGSQSFAVVADAVVALATEKSVGTLTLTARNGDVLTASFTGQGHIVSPGINEIVEHVTITGGTGRYAGATGSFVVNRTLIRAAGMWTGSFAGSIALADGDRRDGEEAASPSAGKDSR